LTNLGSANEERLENVEFQQKRINGPV